MKRVLVCGAGGFIGSHLVKYLKDKSYWVRGVDIKKPDFSESSADEFLVLDLRKKNNCFKATENCEEVFQLAANMGGIFWINNHLADVVRDNLLINLNMLEASRINDIQKYFFSSSACVYPQYLQKEPNVSSLKEEDAFPADPEPGYGWEKLMNELNCQYYQETYGIQVRIARFHNVFGPYGTYEGGREKAPAALCRKIAMAKLTGNPEIEIWGDGEQTRSFMYIDDCVEGIYRIMKSDYNKPLNLGRNKLISINELAYMIALIAGCAITLKHIEGPQGVRGRNSDNTKLKEVLDWEPRIDLKTGLEETYEWIESQIQEKYA